MLLWAFLIYSRARWSDFIHGNGLRLDYNLDGTVAYADMEVRIHKTMHPASNRFRFLDLVASRNGVSGINWVNGWAKAFLSGSIDPENLVPDAVQMVGQVLERFRSVPEGSGEQALPDASPWAKWVAFEACPGIG